MSCQDKRHGFLLFRSEKSKAAEARLSQASSVVTPPAVDGSSSEDATAAEKEAATAKVAGEQLVSLFLLSLLAVVVLVLL